MFVAALPMFSAFTFIANMFILRTSGYKYLKLYQRPIPKGVENIGNWQQIFLMTANASVITNAAITVFTMHVLHGYSTTLRFWIFIGFQWTCFALQAAIMAIIPDDPEDIMIQLERTKFIVQKLIDREDYPDANFHQNASKNEIDIRDYPENFQYREEEDSLIGH
jgi:hypothetical protein